MVTYLQHLSKYNHLFHIHQYIPLAATSMPTTAASSSTRTSCGLAARATGAAPRDLPWFGRHLER